MFVYLMVLLLIVILLRFSYLIFMKNRNESICQRRNTPAKTMIILGSGGHTTEMMRIVDGLDRTKYWPRIYIVAVTDTTSRNKIVELESQSTDYKVINIPRSRHVGQSYFTSIFATIYSIVMSLPMVYRIQPDLILCNGPGTCVPICLIAFFFQMIFINQTCKIVFVESFCRVRSLSLSGKILLWTTDLFVVQWMQLQNHAKKIKYFGRMY